MARSRPRGRTPPVDYAALAELRHQIRRFLRVRETAARVAGIEPQQYLVMLQVKGLTGYRPATIGALAERLQISPHGVVQLIDRLEVRRMVGRRRSGADHRQVAIELRPAGERMLRRLALESLAELRTEGPALVSALTRLIGTSTRTVPRGRRRLTT